MSTSVGTQNNNNHFVNNFILGTAGLVAGWEGETYLRRIIKKPTYYLLDNKFNELRGGGFESYINNAIKQNNLEDDLILLNLNSKTKDSVVKKLGIEEDLKNKMAVKTKTTKIGETIGHTILHIIRLDIDIEEGINEVLIGQNAFFAPEQNAVVCNFDKFGAPVFHELQHKLNSKSSNKLIKFLSKSRDPIAIAGTTAVSAISLFTDKKAPEQKQGFNDKVKNHCGLLATMCMLPLTIEEFIANIKGTKLAEQAGVKSEMLTKVKKAHKLSMISYATGAIATGLACWGGNKIRDLICSNKVKEPQQFGVYHQK